MIRIISFLLLAAFSLRAQDPAAQQTTPNSGSVPVANAGDPLFAPIATREPQDFHQKWMSYVIVTYGPRSFVTPLFPAAIRMLNPPAAYPGDWRHGADAFGHNYGDAAAAGASLETARFMAGALLHEDFRYRPAAQGSSGLHRAFHALAFTLVDKSDSGHNRIALANFAGAAAGGFVGRAYLPEGFKDMTHAETRTMLALGGLAAQNVLREFAPDLLHLAVRLHVPFPHIPGPAWWVKLKG